MKDKYYYSKTLKGGYGNIYLMVKDALELHGFGILTEIDLKKTFYNKLNKDFRKYKILGACNPNFAFRALQNDDKIGTLLPCNVIVQKISDTEIEVAVVNPLVSMKAVDNDDIKSLAAEVNTKLKAVIESLKDEK